jgi:hypothetical protein
MKTEIALSSRQRVVRRLRGDCKEIIRRRIDETGEGVETKGRSEVVK